MPINPDVAIGADLGTREFSWSSSDVLLYHLAIGAGSRTGDNLKPQALALTNDVALQVLPSFAIVAPSFHETAAPSLAMPGIDIDLAQVVHGSQSVTVHGPIPTDGTGTINTKIVDIWDKGKAAVIWQESTVTGADGTALWTARSSIFVKGEGGFSDNRGTSVKVEVPERAPDAQVTYHVTPQQALLYRLCGDRNPLHSDPEFAKGAGFPAPILHGLCSWGIVLREVTEALLDGDATKVGGFTARFAGVVFPNETLAISAWDNGSEIIVSASIVSDNEARNGAPVLADCVVTKA